MDRHVAVAVMLAGLVAAGPVPAADDQAVGIVESEQGTLESFFYGVWARLKALSPRSEDVRVGTDVIATAGLRGADDDNLEMEPYWKGDLTADAAFQQQIEAYRNAIEEGRKGNDQALEAFLEQYGDSDLAANVRFGLAVARFRAGDRETARADLERFTSRYPAHPLVADARVLLQRLGG